MVRLRTLTPQRRRRDRSTSTPLIDATGPGTVPVANSALSDDRQQEKLLKVKEAAEVLCCSEAAIRKWVYQRRLPAVKVGRLTRIRQSDLEAFIRR